MFGWFQFTLGDWIGLRTFSRVVWVCGLRPVGRHFGDLHEEFCENTLKNTECSMKKISWTQLAFLWSKN